MKFPYKEGEWVIIYEDWQNEVNPLGIARLIRKYKSGYTFILKEMMPESSQIVYNYESWIVELEDGRESIIKIRYVERIGITPAHLYPEEDEGDVALRSLVDSFIVINGKEIF